MIRAALNLHRVLGNSSLPWLFSLPVSALADLQGHVQLWLEEHASDAG